MWTLSQACQVQAWCFMVDQKDLGDHSFHPQEEELQTVHTSWSRMMTDGHPCNGAAASVTIL